MSGIFITFEGLDGSGKTTQLNLLADELERSGFAIIATREPGGTALGTAVRELILSENPKPAPLAELLLFAADRAQHVETLIRPALSQNKIVISDRYADATAAYQGAGRGFESTLIRQIIELATSGLQPDLTFFFDLPIAESLHRIARRTVAGESENRLDREKTDFYERVRLEYLTIARCDAERFRIIDGSRSIEEIHRQVLQTTVAFLNAGRDRAKPPAF